MSKITPLSVSICVPAYNEEKNLEKILQALVSQQTKRIHINKIIVISSGSTDRTDEIAGRYAKEFAQVDFVREESRNGKAAAINTFLKLVDDPVVVIESADTVPKPDTIEELCTPFLEDERIGMTGGAPHPVNDPNTFLGYIIHVWWWFHRNIPRFGEIIAYRNVLPQISPVSAVDEAYIQAKIIQLGYRVVHVDSAVVTNKGPETVSDLIKQRRRVLNGHLRLFFSEGIKVDNMNKSAISLISNFKVYSVKEFFWFVGGIFLEFFSRALGYYDVFFLGYNPFVWETAETTKSIN